CDAIGSPMSPSPMNATFIEAVWSGRTGYRHGSGRYLGPDAFVVTIIEHQRANDEGDQRDDDRECQPGIDVPRARDETGGNYRQEPTEPAVAEMVRQGHGCVPDPRRECFDEKRRDRAVYHCHQHDLY